MPEARPVVWAPRAKQDLRGIWHYYARVASPDLADDLLREITHTVERLGARPLLGRPRDEVLQGLRSVLVHPYTIFYRVTAGHVEVARVLHERRDFRAIFAKGKAAPPT